MSLDPRTLEGKMRELLAQEYERETGIKSGEFIRLTKYSGVVSVDLAVAAMVRAHNAALQTV